MSTPDFVKGILGLRKGYPNTADKDSQTSTAIAHQILGLLGLDRHEPMLKNEGRAFEIGVASFVAEQLYGAEPDRYVVEHKGRTIVDFEQYAHLADLARRVALDQNLRVELGPPQDYLIKPDVTVGLARHIGNWKRPYLHASISCKWSIRSDRVQNVRHEAILMTRHRRGRQPHIVAVTAEPLPTRLASIARGTGEVDAVYHATLEELVEATKLVGTREQRDCLDELISQGRLFGIADLIKTLLVT